MTFLRLMGNPLVLGVNRERERERERERRGESVSLSERERERESTLHTLTTGLGPFAYSLLVSQRVKDEVRQREMDILAHSFSMNPPSPSVSPSPSLSPSPSDSARTRATTAMVN